MNNKYEYEYNKFPIGTTEQVAFITMETDAVYNSPDTISGVVFPNVLLPLSIQSSAFQLVSDRIRTATGKPLIKMLDTVQKGYRWNDVYERNSDGTYSKLHEISRNDDTGDLSNKVNNSDYNSTPEIHTVFVNAMHIIRVLPSWVKKPDDIIEAESKYRELAEKGNNSSKGLIDADLENYNKYKDKLTKYYRKAVD